MPGAPRALIRVALALVLLVVVSHTRADPDLWGHVLFGKDIVSGARVPDTDPYSFTSDRAWINHEWLAESVMYVAFAIGGGVGLVFLKMFSLACRDSRIIQVVTNFILRFAGRLFNPIGL
jgi:hypothetical protein